VTTDHLDPLTRRQLARDIEDLADEFAGIFSVETMGCGDACPVYPGKRYLDWQLPDPAGQGLDAVRPIRDDIERRVLALVEDLVGGQRT